MTMFEAGAFSPKLEFESSAPVDTSKTAVGVVRGTRADLGAGEAFTWSATLGFEYRFKPWGGAAFGYRAPSASTRDADEAPSNAAYDMTQYGTFFSLTLHWKQK